MNGIALPIAAYREKIVEAVIDNPTVIVVAETGAGKSTQVPQYLLPVGFDYVTVTQPRRLAARSLAKRVADEYGCSLGETVGFRTGYERCDSAQTRLLYCTDGLELVMAIHRSSKANVLIIDEVYEWNVNIETLVAWAKKRLIQDPDFKVVIMSATLEAGKLSEYFGNAPVIEVEGRLYPVTEKPRRFGTIEEETAALVQGGRNVLVFQPGKSEISKTIKDLELRQLPAVILPLHGEMLPNEQDRVFQPYGQPKVVVATNVAQTSVTIPDIDAVVDSGLVRQIETYDGVEGLYCVPIAEADRKQRMGRAGRCRPGTYIDCYDGRAKGPDFPVPEIQRVRLDQLVLRLLIAGIDPTELEFFHQPDRETLTEAKRLLYVLGALTQEGQVTELGREMTQFPVAVEFARMIVTAEKLKVVDPVLRVVACLEVDGITDGKSFNWRSLTQEEESDLLAQLDVFNAALAMPNTDSLKENGIRPKAFFRAREIYGKLIDIIKRQNGATEVVIEPASRPKIIQACLAGMVDHLYCWTGMTKRYQNRSETLRQLNRSSVVRWGQFIVGLPLDIEVKSLLGPTILNLVTMVTRVEPEVLKALAPHLCRIEFQQHRWNDGTRMVEFRERQTFNGVALDSGKTQQVSWSEIGKFLPADTSAEQLRQSLIEQQFAEQTSWLGRLKPSFAGNDHEDIRRNIQLGLHKFQPQQYGTDPATSEPLYAHPALVWNDKDVLGCWHWQYFPDQKSAEAANFTFQQAARNSINTKTSRMVSVGANSPALNQATTVEEGATGNWRHDGGRDWFCPSGHSVRAPKKGKGNLIVCTICNRTHTIKEA